MALTRICAGALVLFGLLLLALTGTSLAAQPNTLFLPVKVNAATEAAALASAADAELDNALAANAAAAELFRRASRADAEQALDYQAAWPPAADALKSFEDAGYSYLAAGSLSRLGTTLSIDMKVYDLLSPAKPAYFYYQEVADADALGQAFSRIVKEIVALAGRHILIADIAPKGNKRIDSGAILRAMTTKSGDRYDPAKLREDLKNVFRMGYFDDVRLDVQDTEKGKAVTIEVVEKPVIGQINIEGAKELKEETVLEAVTIFPNTILNPKKVQEAETTIYNLYKEKGFYDTKVTSRISTPEKDRVTVTFAIEEGEKIYIKEIIFSGNQTFKAKELSKTIETSEKGLLSWITDSGILKRDVLEQDVARLTAFYNHHGFIEAKVGAPEVRQEGEWLLITFNIEEGPRYRVGEITISGDLIDDQETLRGILKLGDEEYLSRKILREDIMRLNDYYAEHGYAFAESTPMLEKRPEELKVDINIVVQKNSLVHINRVLITGNTRTRDKVIRRQMEIKERGIFNSKAIRQSHQKLQRLDFFEEVQITPEPTGEEDLMDIHVAVKEKPTGTFSLGAGYSSVDSFMFMGEISQNNFLGKGQRLSLAANMSSSSTRFNLGFTEPYLLDTKLLFGVDAYNWQREYDDYTKDSYGGGLRFGYPIRENWRLGFGYGWDHTDVKDVDPTVPHSQILLDSLDIKITSYATVSLTRDTLNHPFDPSKGSLNQVSVKYAGGPLGGDNEFTRLEGASNWFFPLFWDTVYSLQFSAGQVFSDSFVPVFERYYLGGLRTIRGFKPGQISPIDPATGERIGGDRMWYVNNEWIFPLVKDAGLKGLVFFDVGNVYDGTWGDVDTTKKAVGLGFRWLSPMGPLRLEWGYNLDPVDDEDQSNWDFSIGGSF